MRSLSYLQRGANRMKVRRGAPKKIYLQFNENDGEVTWSEDRINESDIVYFRKTKKLNRKGKGK